MFAPIHWNRARGRKLRELYEYHYPFDDIEHLHDNGVVRPFEIQRLSAMEGSHNQLVHRVRRVLFSGSGQPDRVLSIFSRPAEDHPGSNHFAGFLHFLGRLSTRKFEMELYRRVCSYPWRGLLCIQEMVARNRLDSIMPSRCPSPSPVAD